MSVVIPSSILQYGIPLSSVISFAGVIRKWAKASKNVKALSVVLMILLMLAGVGIRVFNYKIVLPSFALEGLLSALSLSESSFEQIYISLFFVGITSLFFFVFYLIISRKFAFSLMLAFNILIMSMPLVVICTLLGLSALISAVISSVATIVVLVIIALIFSSNINRLTIVSSVYAVVLHFINLIFILVLLINSNFGGMLSLAFWTAPPDALSVNILDTVVHQYIIAFLPTLLFNIIYISIVYKSINDKNKKLYYTLDVIKKWSYLISVTGITGALLMLLPIRFPIYTVKMLIAFAIASVIHITISIIGEKQGSTFIEKFVAEGQQEKERQNNNTWV
jgi:hypothetical protein